MNRLSKFVAGDGTAWDRAMAGIQAYVGSASTPPTSGS